MWMSIGKRFTGSDIRRSPEPDCKMQRTTSQEWKRWLHTITNFVGGVEDRSKDPRPYVTVTVFDQDFKALIDTGAVVNLIGTKVVDHLRLHGIKRRPTKTELRMVDGSGCEVNEEYFVRGKVGETSYSWKAYYVSSLASDLILGIRCIQEMNLLNLNTEGPGKSLPTGDKLENGVNAIVTPTVKRGDGRFYELPDNTVAGKIEHVILPKNNLVPVKQCLNEVGMLLRDDVIRSSRGPQKNDESIYNRPIRRGCQLTKVGSSDFGDGSQVPATETSDEHRSLKTVESVRPLSPCLGLEGGEVPIGKITVYSSGVSRPHPKVTESVINRLQATFDTTTTAERRRKRWRIYLTDGTFVRVRPNALKHLVVDRLMSEN